MTRALAFAASLLAAASFIGAPAAAAAGASPAEQQAAAAADATWASLVTDVFENRPMQDGTGIVTLETPARAEDAAIVPVVLGAALPAGDSRSIRRITLVIDQNPAPVAAEFELGPTAGVDRIETRVRVNAYTRVHAVAEASDGMLYVVERFVKASGGCSAPAGKDPALAMKNLGQMKLRQFAATNAAGGRREAQVMVRHPNNSGLQMDQVKRTYIPAFFVNELTVSQGEDLVMRVSGGISISEDPNVRFTYRPNGASAFTVRAVDTDGNVFEQRYPVETGS